jgi:murein DD-endopeptidase MepM/ murein hydrolase activator NlpD
MSYARRAAVSAVMTIAFSGTTALARAPAPAPGYASGGTPAPTTREGGSGGARSPTVALSGGSEYGVYTQAVSTARPVVSQLSVPGTAVPGRPPRVALRIDETGVGTVNVGVTVTDLATGRLAIAVGMGWVRTGRTVTVRWPRGATLKPGSYEVSLSAHDHRSGTLLRRAHSSGVALLTVRAPANVPPPVAPPGAGPEVGVLTPVQTAAAGAVFPVAGPHNFGGPENRFGAPRQGHVHQGQDVLTTEGTAIVTPMAGAILTTSYQASGAGYYAVEHTPVGFDFLFAHCAAGSLAVSTGQAVSGGQALCQAGQTGSATTPHLHFEMWVGGWQAAGGHPIDPLPYLEAWDHVGAGG